MGILEDVLSDERVTDVYVNSPADINPIHVVVDGEECSSNIYLSQDDIDSMITRFRAISGRPFGEANPVLDMDLPEYQDKSISNRRSAIIRRILLTLSGNMREIHGRFQS